MIRDNRALNGLMLVWLVAAIRARARLTLSRCKTYFPTSILGAAANGLIPSLG